MEIQKTNSLHSHPFIKEMAESKPSISVLYNGTSADIDSCKKRMAAINCYSKGKVNLATRADIAISLQHYHEKLASLVNKDKVESLVVNNIQQYANGCYTVVTGQQAGLFTGPLYTINKIISLLKTVSEVKKLLAVDIIPIFWIAGEDHDIDEIDHTYINTYNQLNRLSLSWSSKPNISVANVNLTKNQINDVLTNLKKILPDSAFKKDILDRLYYVYTNASLSIAFAALLYDIFAPYGLVLFDSHDELIRVQQLPMFSKIIEDADEIIHANGTGFKQMLDTGYIPQAGINDQRVGIHINQYGKRRAVSKTVQGFVIDKIVGVKLKTELLEMLHREPHIFSTNVLLRPIMQEYLFQPLIYIGGAAEVMYWGQLKPLFTMFEYSMPIVTLRNSYTYVSQKVQEKAKKYDVMIEDIIGKKSISISDFDNTSNHDNFDIEKHFKLVESEIERTWNNSINAVPSTYVHSKFTKYIGQKSLQSVKKQLEQMKFELKKQNEDKTQTIRLDLKWIERDIMPYNNHQERVVNIYQFLNDSGADFIGELVDDRKHTMCGRHFIVNM